MIGIRKDTDPDLREVFAKGFPAYPQAVDLSSPTNSSPYRMTAADLREAFQDDPWRLHLLANVDTVLDELASRGVNIPGFLIGGGFVRRLKDGTRPRDIDSVAFYKAEGVSPDEVAPALSGAARAAKSLQIDMRFCPLDANPILMMKSLIFYSVLFRKSEGRMEIENGLILYDRH